MAPQQKVQEQKCADVESGTSSSGGAEFETASGMDSTSDKSEPMDGGHANMLEAGDDFALDRIPFEARYSWMSLALENWSVGGCISSVLLGVTLGARMTLQNALLACVLGNVILGAISFAIGSVGCREGLATAMLCRWSGFGSTGTAVVSVAIAISLTGWFGIQSAIAGSGLVSLLGGPPSWVWTLIAGAFVTLVSVSGFRWMVNIAWVTAPAFLAAIVWAVARSLTMHSLAELAAMQPKGEPLTLFDGIGLIVGGFAVGATVCADMFRFSRSSTGVAAAVLLGRMPALVLYNSAGVLIALAYESSDLIALMRSSVGWGAIIIVVAGELVINATNVYFTGLAVVAFCDTALGFQISRRSVTLICGILGSTLGAAGLLSHFVDFLCVLSVTFPPIAGILLCEYCCVRQFRKDLDSTRKSGVLPSEAATWVPTTLVVWLAASLLGWFIKVGIPCLYSFFGAAILYAFAAWCGALRSCGITHTERMVKAGKPCGIAQ